MFGRRILGGPPDGFKLLLGYEVAHKLSSMLVFSCTASVGLVHALMLSNDVLLASHDHVALIPQRGSAFSSSRP